MVHELFNWIDSYLIDVDRYEMTTVPAEQWSQRGILGLGVPESAIL